MNAFFKATALAAATASLATALPASAAVSFAPTHSFVAPGEQEYGHWRERYSREDRRRGYGNRDRYYRGDRGYRGDRRYYDCRRSGGTTGLLVGGAAGALAGRAIDTRGDRATGTVLGAAAGALLGREVERGGSRCR